MVQLARRKFLELDYHLFSFLFFVFHILFYRYYRHNIEPKKSKSRKKLHLKIKWHISNAVLFSKR